MVTCIIVDDEQHAIDLLLMHAAKLDLLQVQLATTSAIEAFSYIQRHSVDLIFLDIQMPGLTGLQFMKLLKGKSKVILTTAYAEHALESYEHDVVDYLLKPIVFDRFLKAVQKAINVTHTTTPANKADELPGVKDFIFVKTQARKIIKIVLEEIEYVESLGNYLAIHTSSGKFTLLLSMKELCKKLPAEQFIRIHNSYMVSFNKIIEVNGNQVRLKKQGLPIGERYKKSFF